MSTIPLRDSLRLISAEDEWLPGSWVKSNWNTGQSKIQSYSPDNLRWDPNGNLEFVLSRAPEGSERPWRGAEIQSTLAASTGTWSWTAQVPDLPSGSVFGMFTYKADWEFAPWIEFDFEFLGIDGRDVDGDGDTDISKVRLNIHMETPTGDHVSLEEANRAPVLVDLGFDATEGFHTYEVVITGTEAIFVVDGGEVARFDADDMPGGLWTTGEMRGFVNLWAVDSSMPSWGTWTDPGREVVGRVSALDIRPNDLGAYGPRPLVLGTAGADTLLGAAVAEQIEGLGGDDVISGGGGDDRLLGGDGNDRLRLDAGNDRLEGGAGTDWVEAQGSVAVTVDLAQVGGQVTGHGTDSLAGVENAQGGSGADRLLGNAAANTLMGGIGADLILGRGGRDTLWGGADSDVFAFEAVSDSFIGQRRDSVHDFVSGVDDFDLRGIDANTGAAGNNAFLGFAGTTATAHAVWYLPGRGEIYLRADVNGDKTADFEVRLVGVKALSAADFVRSVGTLEESLL